MQLIKWFLSALLLCWSSGLFSAFGQVTDSTFSKLEIDYKAEIGGIRVNGAVWSDETTLINIAGLKIGDPIKIPGVKISASLKALWKLGLFSDVQIQLEKTIGEIAYLVIEVAEINRLTAVDIVGVKKSKLEEVSRIAIQQLRLGRKLTEIQKKRAVNALQKYYTEQGYADAVIEAEEIT